MDWRLEGDNTNSTIIDSISISPQECYTLDILHGAGSLNGVIGDVIFHCHLYPHFHEGMWTLWRIHDRLEDGTGMLLDGTPIPALQPLRDRKRPLKKDKWHRREQRMDSFSRVIPLQGAISIGNKFDIELENGASCPGDYLYRSGSLKWDVESGMWGIFRVMKQGLGCKCKNVCRNVAKRIFER